LVEGYNRQPEVAFTRTPYEVGLPRQRRQFTDTFEVIQVKWKWRRTHMVDFEAWYDVGLRQGTEKFNFQVLGLIPTQDSWWVAFFLEPYQAQIIDWDAWSVSAKIMLTGVPFAAIDPEANLTAALATSFSLTSTLKNNTNLTAALTSVFTITADGTAMAPPAAAVTSVFTSTSTLRNRMTLARLVSMGAATARKSQSAILASPEARRRAYLGLGAKTWH
jgi:hypothetical protein